MRELRVALVPGDGIGVAVMAEAVKALTAVADTAGDTVFMTPFDWGAERYLRTKETLPARSVETLAGAFDAVFLGPLGDPRVPDDRHAAAIVRGLCAGLDLYVHHRPVFPLHDKLCPLEDAGAADVAFDLFHENVCGEGAAESHTGGHENVERVVRHVFAHAQGRRRARVALAEPSDVSDDDRALWRQVFVRVAAAQPAIEATHCDADTLARDLWRDPRPFQVIVVAGRTGGGVLADHATRLQGGVAASASVRPGGVGLFRPVHGTAAAAAANPVGAILAGALMLEHAGWTDSARRIEDAVRWAVANGRTTPDVGGALSTRAAGDAIMGRLLARPLMDSVAADTILPATPHSTAR